VGIVRVTTGMGEEVVGTGSSSLPPHIIIITQWVTGTGLMGFIA